MSDKKEERKTDEEVLFSEAKVKLSNGKEYTVKPWTFGQLVQCNNDIEKIFVEAKERGTDIDKDDFTISTLSNMYFSIVPQVGNIISKTLDIDMEEVNELSIEDVTVLATAIFNANKDSLKNALSPFFQITGSQGATEQSPKTK